MIATGCDINMAGITFDLIVKCLERASGVVPYCALPDN